MEGLRAKGLGAIVSFGVALGGVNLLAPTASAAVDCGAEVVCDDVDPVDPCTILSDWGDFVAKVLRDLNGAITLVTSATPHATNRQIVTACGTVHFRTYADFEVKTTATDCGNADRVPRCAAAPGAALLFDDPLTTKEDDWDSTSDGIWCGPGTCVSFDAGVFSHEADIVKYTANFKVDVRGEAHARYYEDSDNDGGLSDEDPLHQFDPKTVHYEFIP